MSTMIRLRSCTACLFALLLGMVANPGHAHLILAPESCAIVSNASGSPAVVTECDISVAISADEITSQGGPFSNGAFFTIYDAGPLADGPAATILTGSLTHRWAIFSELVDTPAIGTTPFDDPALVNIRLLCANCGTFSGESLGTFRISFAGAFDTRVLTYDSSAFDITTRVDIGTLGSLRLTTVPEPATLALLALGLALIAARRRSTSAPSP